MPADPTAPNRRRIWPTVLSYSTVGFLCFFLGRFSISRVTPPPTNSQSPNIRYTKAEAKPTLSTDPTSSADNSAVRWDDPSWRKLKAKPASPANTTALAALLEKLATTDSQQALALA